MLIYFIVFLISGSFAYLAYKSKIKFNRILFGILAVLIPSLLAGLRSKGVGTDTLYYMDAAFKFARASSSFGNLLKVSNIEILYNLVNYIVSRLSSNVNLLYFTVQFIICSCTYIACVKCKKICPSWISYLLFLLLFYNRSLNMCRQSIALSFMLLSFSYAIDKKFVKYIICVLLAIGFHKTAIVCIPMYFFVSLLQTKGKYIYKLFLFLIFLFIVVFYKNIVSFLTLDLNLIANRYMYYTQNTESHIIMLELLGKVCVLLIYYVIFGKKIKSLNKYNHILLFFMIIDLLLYLVGFYANYAQRLSYYLGYLIIFLLPQIINVSKKDKLYFVMILLFVISSYSYLYYGVAGYDQTVPYRSEILNIGGSYE